MSSFLRRMGLGGRAGRKRRPSLETFNMEDGAEESNEATMSGACEALMFVPGGDYAPGTGTLDLNDYTDEEDDLDSVKGPAEYEFDRPPMEHATARAQSYDDRRIATDYSTGEIMEYKLKERNIPNGTPSITPEATPKMAHRWTPQRAVSITSTVSDFDMDEPELERNERRSSPYPPPKSRDVHHHVISDRQEKPKSGRGISLSDTVSDYSTDFSDEENDDRGPARLASSEMFDSQDEPSISMEKHRIVSPETMQETLMTDSEDEGGEDTIPGGDMKFLGDDSLSTPTKDDYDLRRREQQEMEAMERAKQEAMEARRQAWETEQRERRHRMKRELEPEECAQLGALPRQIPQKKAQVQDLEEELLRLHHQVDRVVNVNTNTSYSQPPPKPGAVEEQDSADGSIRPSHSNIVNPGHEESPRDVEEIKRRITEIEKHRSILKEQADLEEARLTELRQRAQSNSKVKNALQIYRNAKDKFLDSLFNSAQLGNLCDVAIQTAVLDIVGKSDLENLIHKYTKLPLIHLALIHGQENIVKFLLMHSGKNIAKAPAKTEECTNLTPLYIAMQYTSYEKVKILVDSVPKEANERAHYINQLVPNKAYDGTPYNELPLAGSVWSSVGKNDQTQLKKMLEYLVDNGADLELATSTGDTLLHLLVLQAVESIDHLEYIRTFLKTTFSKAVGKWWKLSKHSHGRESMEVAEMHGIKYLMNVMNNEHLNPLALAARSESPLYSDLVNWENVMRFPDRKTGQEFSNVDTFNITNITSVSQSGKGHKYNQFSVMHVLAHNNVDLSQKEWNVDIACLEPLRSIINRKWNVYGWIFYLWGIFHIIHMTTFTALTFQYKGNATEMTKNVSNENGTEKAETVTVVTPGIPYFVFFLVLPVVYLITEAMDFFLTGDKFEFGLSLIGNGVYRFLAGVFSLFTIVWFILHMVQIVHQDIMLSMAILFGWLFCIFFTRTISFPSRNSQIGAFSIMVQRMLFHDMIAFIVLSFFIIVAFSGAMHALMLYSKGRSTDLNFGDTFFDMLKYYSSIDDGQGYDSSREVQFAKFLLTLYCIISVVLLVNMLIAAMNKTYDLVRETRIDLVMRQKLSIMLLMERRLPFVRGMAEKHFNSVPNHRQKTLEVFIKVVSRKSIANLLKRSK